MPLKPHHTATTATLWPIFQRQDIDFPLNIRQYLNLLHFPCVLLKIQPIGILHLILLQIVLICRIYQYLIIAALLNK